jgi:hypothetical protein
MTTGKRFFEFLKAKKQADGYHLSRSVLPGWYVSFQTSINLSTMDKVALIDGVCANPGPFKGGVDFFSLSSEAGEDQSIYTTTEEYRRTISRLSGIRVALPQLELLIGVAA